MISLDDVKLASGRIAGVVARTPCLHSLTLSRLAGAEVFLKFENLQFTASFKERGALNKLLSLTDAERRRGVIAMSAGNHAQAVAYHAARLGIPAVIVMPKGSPNSKIRNTLVHGAEVVLEGESLSDAARHAHQRATRDSLVFVHPYEDPLVIAGQGTVALEMLQEVPGLEMLVVPVGGGGLIAGMTIAAKSMQPGIQIAVVESKIYPSMHQRLNGLPVSVGGDTIAEGIAVKDVGNISFELMKKHSIEILTVEEETIERAVVALCEIEKTVAEGAGAAGLAALLEHPERFRGRRVGIPITGGNIDSRVLASVLMRGLARDGRMVRLRVSLADVSGSPGECHRADRAGRRQYRRGAAPAHFRCRLGALDRSGIPARDPRPRAHRGAARGTPEKRGQGDFSMNAMPQPVPAGSGARAPRGKLAR